MSNFAIIKNNVVLNTIVAESKEIAENLSGNECVEYTKENSAHIGLSYSPESGLFEQPAVDDNILFVSPVDGELIGKEEYEALVAEDS